MAQVTLTVNGRSYEVACDDGQEDHLLELARMVDGRVRDLAASVGAVGEPRLLVMTSLLIADELHEARRGLEAARSGGGSAAGGSEPAAAEALEGCAERLERIAARLEAP